MITWLERYRSGDHIQVWAEMVGVGASIRGQASELQDASAVAVETMRRARTNVERLAELLPAAGYVFEAGPDQPAFEPPNPDIIEQLHRLEEKVGVLPLALRSWYEEVGRVNFVGHHPAWDFPYSDPLVVDAPVNWVLSEYDEWAEQRGTERDRGAFTIDVAPDYLHKADISGGAPYCLEVPNHGVDGFLLWERHQTTFVNYLRLAFRCGGFSGPFLYAEGLNGSANPCPPPEVLNEVADALLPL